MSIEIKGLAAGVLAARKGITDARAKVATMQEAGAALAATVDDVTKALKAAEADIRFEAQQLGNGGVNAEPSDPPLKPVITPPQPLPDTPAAGAQVTPFRGTGNSAA